MTIKTRPATPEFRDGYERVFGKKTADGYTHKTYAIEGAIRTPEMRMALDRSMQLLRGVGLIRGDR